jgi:hypothetical protein
VGKQHVQNKRALKAQENKERKRRSGRIKLEKK